MSSKFFNLFSFFLFLGSILILTSCSKEEPLLSRKVLFGNPDKASLKISPNHQMISYLAPLNDVLNIWVAPIDNPEKAVVVTKDTLRGIRTYFWSYNNEQIIYLQDLGGDENWQVHAVNVDTKEDINLTAFEEIIGPDGQPCARGVTVHALTDLTGVTQYRVPQDIAERIEQMLCWAEGDDW